LDYYKHDAYPSADWLEHEFYDQYPEAFRYDDPCHTRKHVLAGEDYLNDSEEYWNSDDEDDEDNQ
jgi:hypothetical protein